VCAERRHILKLIHNAKVKGVANHKIVHWIHKHEVELVVERFDANGKVANSLPCVLCKQMLDKYKIKWMAFFEGKWVKSTDDDVPVSRPTSRQAAQLFKKPKQP
jgi:cytidine deaminase